MMKIIFLTIWVRIFWKASHSVLEGHIQLLYLTGLPPIYNLYKVFSAQNINSIVLYDNFPAYAKFRIKNKTLRFMCKVAC